MSLVESLAVEFLDTGSGVVVSSEAQLHDEFTVSVFEKLIGYIRECTWSTNDTTQFVARNFMVAQSDLPHLWASMYPDKPVKADSTFRVQYQNINRYLASVFPSNLYDIFINDERTLLEKLSLTLDSLKFNDRRIEDELGSPLCHILSQLDLSSKRFTLEDCKKELFLMNKLSTVNNVRELENCDKDKLAFVYWVLTRPSVVNGNINKTRLDFINAMLSFTDDEFITKDMDITVSSDASLYGVLRYLYDVLETKSKDEIISICKGTLVQYKQYKDSKNYVLLNRVEQLVSSGNDLSAVKKLLASNLLTGGTQTTQLEQEEPLTLQKALDFIRTSISTDDEVESILSTLSETCIEKGLSYSVLNGGGMKIVKQYVEGVEPDEDTFANADVINFIHLYCTKSGIESGLRRFSKKDVAYIIKELEKGNKDYINSIKTGINIDSINCIGNSKMCSEAKQEIEKLVADAEPSDVTNGEAYSIVQDYTINEMRRRLSSVPASDLARVYDEMLYSDEGI